MSDNLQPGTTAADIDKHFGEPQHERYAGVVHVDVVAEVLKGATKREIRAELLENVDDGEPVAAEIMGKL